MKWHNNAFSAQSEVLSEVHISFLIQIEKGHQERERMKGYVDGDAFGKHSLFSQHRNALQIYYDDLQMCNPLGFKAKVWGTLSETFVADLKKLASIK